MHNHSRIMAEKREMGKLNFHSLFQKVDKLEDGISFCQLQFTAKIGVKCPTCGDELSKLQN